jgi:hypothetical protein
LEAIDAIHALGVTDVIAHQFQVVLRMGGYRHGKQANDAINVFHGISF